VPAKAGTHYHRLLLLCRAVAPACATTCACGNGSRIGARSRSLVRDDGGVCCASFARGYHAPPILAGRNRMSSLSGKQGPRYRHVADESEPYETIGVEKLTPIIGAEISGVDIGRLVDSEARSNRQMDEIHRALAENL